MDNDPSDEILGANWGQDWRFKRNSDITQTKWEIDVSLDVSMRCDVDPMLPECVHNVPDLGSNPSRATLLYLSPVP